MTLLAQCTDCKEWTEFEQNPDQLIQSWHIACQTCGTETLNPQTTISKRTFRKKQ